MGCSEYAVQGIHWLVTRYRTAKVVYIPRGSSPGMFAIHSTTAESKSSRRADLSFSRRWVDLSRLSIIVKKNTTGKLWRQRSVVMGEDEWKWVRGITKNDADGTNVKLARGWKRSGPLSGKGCVPPAGSTESLCPKLGSILCDTSLDLWRGSCCCGVSHRKQPAGRLNPSHSAPLGSQEE